MENDSWWNSAPKHQQQSWKQHDEAEAQRRGVTVAFIRRERAKQSEAGRQKIADRNADNKFRKEQTHLAVNFGTTDDADPAAATDDGEPHHHVETDAYETVTDDMSALDAYFPSSDSDDVSEHSFAASLHQCCKKARVG